MKRIKRFLPLILTVVVLLAFLAGLSVLERDNRAEGRQQLEEVLRRTAATCYSAEGFYPPNLSYMEEHYGLTYNKNRYVVFYEIFASNLMPTITVLEK